LRAFGHAGCDVHLRERAPDLGIVGGVCDGLLGAAPSVLEITSGCEQRVRNLSFLKTLSIARCEL